MPSLKDFFKKYEHKIVLVLGLVLIAGLSFQVGFLKGQKMPQNPLIIETSNNCPKIENQVLGAQNQALENVSTTKNKLSQKQDCMFVGSKNSNKYHLPDCRFAKNIKPENLVCFSSAEDASSKGYLPDKTCVK